MKKITYLLAIGLFLILAGKTSAQLSGVYTVPGSYSSIGGAITALNTLGVSGPVTVNISTGYTETVTAGGYTLNAITGASSTNSITFQRSGTGANPIIYANTSGTNTPASASQDGIWFFNGTDFVTINGIDLTDPNTTNPASMEFGYGFFKASATDGCQNNTIRNCTITLNRVNNAAGSGPAIDGSRGIDMVNATMIAHTTAVTVTSASGSHSGNKFYSNVIQNCNYGISLIGFAAASPFTLADQNNDIGGSSASTGNSIINFGGGGTTSPAAGIRTLAQYNLNISNNTINNNNGSGVNHATTLRAIYFNTASGANLTVNNNTCTIKNSGTTSQVSIIETVSGGVVNSNTISITNNLIANCTNTAATTGVFYGIWNSNPTQNLIITGNTFTNNTTNATSATYYLIYNNASVPGVVTIANNTVGGFTFNNSSTAYSGTYYNIYNSSGATTATVSISNNTFSNYNFANLPGTGTIYWMYNGASVAYLTYSANACVNQTVNHTGTNYWMYNGSSTQTLLTIANNTLSGITRTVAPGSLYHYYACASSLGTSQQVMTNNLCTNITATNVAGSGTFYGFYTCDGSASPYPRKTVSGNTFSNINMNSSGSFYGYYIAYAGDGSTTVGSTISNNLINNITWGAGSMYLLYPSTPTSPTYTESVFSNTVTNCSNTAGTLYGGYVFCSTGGINFYKNKIAGLTNIGTSGLVYGTYFSPSGPAQFHNNTIGALFTPSTSGTNQIYGLYAAGGTTTSINYNTVYMNAVSSGANFGSTAFYNSTSPVTALKNNIFLNNSTPNGTGKTYSHYRSSVTISTYSAGSNNNLFYAGTPSANNLIYFDGTNSISSLGAYKTLLSTLDQQAVTENVNFASTSPAATNFLNINASLATLVESGGTPVSGITDDVIGTTRNASTPDIGAWEGSYIPYTPCSGTPPANTVLSNSTTICPNANVNLSLANSYTLTGLSYQWLSSTTSSTSGFSAVSGATTSALTATNIPATTWYQCAVTCTNSSQTNTTSALQINMGPPAFPATVLSPTLFCTGQTLNLSLASALTGVSYQWMASTTASNSGYSPIANATLATAAVTGTATTWFQAVIACSANASYSGANVPALATILANPVYTNTPFLENFDATWQNRCDLRNVPIAACWSSNPTTGNNSWRRQDDGASAVWTSVSTGINPPLTGAGCANFHSYYAGSGTTGALSLYLNMTAASPNYSLSFYYRNASGSDVMNVLLSTNGGTSFSNIGSYGVSSSWAKQTINLGAVNSSSCIITFSATSDFGNDDIGIDSLQVKTCPALVPVAVTPSVCPGTVASLSVSGANSYVWSTSATGPSITVTPTANAVYTVSGSNGFCVASQTVAVGFNPTPTLNISGSTGICTGQTASLTASGASTYTWSTGAVSNSITAAPATNTFYTVNATSAVGCTATLTQSVSVAASLSISIAGPSTICMGQAANLTGNGGVTYTWNTGATTSTIAPTPSVNTTYTVIGASGTCSNTGVATVSVNPIPTVAITGGGGTVCAGSTVTLNAGGAASYTWNTSSNAVAISVTPIANTNYTLTGSNSFGCTNSASTSIVTNTIPIIALAQSAGSVCLNTPATFTASGASTYTWSTSSNNSTVSISPTATAVYSVSGTNPAGCVATKTFVLGTFTLPVITISPASTTVCSLAQTGFTASGANTYTWNNTSTLTGFSVLLTPSSNIIYTVTGTNGTGCVSTATVGVVTNSLPVVSIAPTSTTVCAFSAASFTASGATTYTWNSTTPGSTITLFQGSNTTHTVTGTNALGCSSSSTVNVTTTPLPTLTLTPTFTTVCALATATLSASGANTYSWSSGSTSATAVVTPSAITAYTVTGTDALGCSTSSVAVVITNTLPSIAIAPATATVCSLAPVSVTASGALSYTWSTGPNTASVTLTPSANTVYTVTGIDPNNGCVGSQTVAISTNPLPSISVAPAGSSVCLGNTASLTASGATTFTWLVSGNTTATTAVTPTANTVYTVTGTDNLGCVGNKTVAVNLFPLTNVVASPASQTICLNETATVTASGANTFTWSPVAGTSNVFTVTPTLFGGYTLTGTDANSCTGSTVFFIYVNSCLGIANNSANANLVSVFPNPSTGFVTAKLEFEGRKQLELFNELGQVIELRVTENTIENFNLTGYAKGIYYIKVTSKEVSGNYKVVIQ